MDLCKWEGGLVRLFIGLLGQFSLNGFLFHVALDFTDGGFAEAGGFGHATGAFLESEEVAGSGVLLGIVDGGVP